MARACRRPPRPARSARSAASAAACSRARAAGACEAVAGDPLHPVNRGRTCRKPLELGAAVHAPDRAAAPLVRAAATRASTRPAGTTALGHLAGRLRAIRRRARPGRDRLLHLRPAADRGLLRGQQARQGLPRHQQRRLELAAVHVLRGRRLHRRLRHRRPAAVLRRPRATPTASCCSARTPPRATRSSGRGSATARPRARSSSAPTRGATPTARRPRTCTCRCAPGPTWRCSTRCSTCSTATGIVDEAFVARHTSGWDEALAVAREWTPERAAAVCGVPAPRRSRRRPRASRGAAAAMALWSMGANQSTVGTLKNRALINLCLATGNIGRPGAGPLSLTGQPNAMGGRETGGLAHLLPGLPARGRRRAPRRDGGALGRARRASRRAPGLPAVELFDAARRRARQGGLDRRDEPGRVAARHRARARGARAAPSCVVVQDAHHPTETSALAHAVLPAAAWPEKEGTMTNSERRVGPRPPGCSTRRAGTRGPTGRSSPAWPRALGFGDALRLADAGGGLRRVRRLHGRAAVRRVRPSPRAPAARGQRPVARARVPGGTTGPSASTRTGAFTPPTGARASRRPRTPRPPRRRRATTRCCSPRAASPTSGTR